MSVGHALHLPVVRFSSVSSGTRLPAARMRAARDKRDDSGCRRISIEHLQCCRTVVQHGRKVLRIEKSMHDDAHLRHIGATCAFTYDAQGVHYASEPWHSWHWCALVHIAAHSCHITAAMGHVEAWL